MRHSLKYEENHVHSIALGTQHVVVLASDNFLLPPMKMEEFEVAVDDDAPAAKIEDDNMSVKSGKSSKKS